MFSHVKVRKLEDYFLPLSKRPERAVYFTRLNGFNSQIRDFLIQYYGEARRNGVVLAGTLPEPMQGNVDYYFDKVGSDFQLSLGFLEQSLKNWDPTAGMRNKRELSVQIYDSLYERAAAGASRGEQQQIFIRYMCWMYTRFRQVIPRLGDEQLPKLLYLGTVREEELRFFSILSAAGSDIVLVQPQGDSAYLALDPTSARSDAWIPQGQGSFPEGFGVKWLQEKEQSAIREAPVPGGSGRGGAVSRGSEKQGRGTSGGPGSEIHKGQSPQPAPAFRTPHTTTASSLPPSQHIVWENMETEPQDVDELFAATTAFAAERELDTMLYEDSGLFRAHQFRKASVVFLKMTYEELFLFWDKSPKLRPSFEAKEQEVKIPVLLARVCGVPQRDVPSYWQTVGKLWTADTILVRRLPFAGSGGENPFRRHAPMLLRDGKLLRGRIRQLSEYEARFGMLRQEMQEHILDKVQYMIDKRLMKGTGKSGTEYVIVSTALFMDQAVIRQIQSFDFTSMNPKLLVVHTEETSFTLEDAITFLLLALIGFDVALWIPTGFQGPEKYYTVNPFRDFQAGEYVYDLTVPGDEALRPRQAPKEKGTLEKLWGRFSHRKEDPHVI